MAITLILAIVVNILLLEILVPCALVVVPPPQVLQTIMLEWTVSTIAHELTKTATDPLLNGWFSANNGQENADKCAWTYGSVYVNSAREKKTITQFKIVVFQQRAFFLLTEALCYGFRKILLHGWGKFQAVFGSKELESTNWNLCQFCLRNLKNKELL